MNKLSHVAFIMDGNGRWGRKKNKGRNFGHLKGVEVVKNIVKNSIEFKVPIVTFYVFLQKIGTVLKQKLNIYLIS